MDYKLSVGFNGNLELLDKMLENNNKIKNIYTGGFLREVSSGRFQFSDDEKKLEKISNKVHDKGVNLAITLNSPCNIPPLSNKDWWRKIRKYLSTLESIGVNTLIVAHPFLMDLARDHTNMEIVASIICDITSVRGALYYENMGANVIVPSSSINYDLELLKNIKNNLHEAQIKLLVNEACLGNCPWRRYHQNALSHADSKSYDIDYAMNCTTLYKDEPYMMLTNNVIRPEDLIKYEGICDYFKLVGRTTDNETLLKMIKAYSEGKYNGNLVEIVDKEFSKFINLPNEKLTDLFEQKTNCIKNCQNCDKCKKLYRKVIS